MDFLLTNALTFMTEFHRSTSLILKVSQNTSPPAPSQHWLLSTLCHCCNVNKAHHTLVDGLAQGFWQVLLEAAVITHLNLIYFYFRKLPNNTKDFFPASHWNCVHIAMATMPETFVVPDPFYWLLGICAIKIYI